MCEAEMFERQELVERGVCAMAVLDRDGGGVGGVPWRCLIGMEVEWRVCHGGA